MSVSRSSLPPRRQLALGSAILLAGTVAVTAIAAPGEKLDKDAVIRQFETEVRPTLTTTCVSCHGPKVQLGGLRLDTKAGLLKGGAHGPVIVPGHPEKSPLIEAIRYQGKIKMPPAGPIKPGQIEALVQWVQQGAVWPDVSAKARTTGVLGDTWAFSKPARPPLPKVKLASWVRNPIDAFVLAYLEKRGLKPSPYADRRTLIRRVSLDLTGLPPTPEAVEAFVNDRAPGAYERVVDRLLASPQYGERMALHWLDLARYADSDGYHDDTTRLMWKYRDYVIRAFNANMPFDQFTIEQLGGDLLPNATTDQKIASAFNRCGPTSSEGGAIPEEVLAAYAVDRVNTTSTVWLGLTMQCVQCHDHKYDPLSAREYYQFFSFFNQVPEEALYRGTDAPPTLLAPNPQQQAKLNELSSQIEALDKELAPQAAADAPAEKARVEAVKKKLDAAKAARATVEKESRIRIMQDISPRRETHMLLRGDYRKPGDIVQPGVPAVLGVFPAASKGIATRVDLAKWLVDPANPMTSRVTVNRYWAMLFGAGLVRTVDDFGARGERPSHPALLDYLAVAYSSPKSQVQRPKQADRLAPMNSGVREVGARSTTSAHNQPQGRGQSAVFDFGPETLDFTALGWDTKALLRLIVTSATYQQSSKLTPESVARDPQNRWLARGPRFRLPAELIRDNALAIAGLIDRKRDIGGPSVKPYQPGDLWREVSAGDDPTKSYVQDHGPDLYRRGLYTFWKRSILYPSFAVFDAPKREVCAAFRPTTNTPLQAFVTLNDLTYVESARVLAQSVLEKGQRTFDLRLDEIYLRALARKPTPAERKDMHLLYNETLAAYRADAKGALALASAGEYARPKDLDPVEHAVWTCICNALLNLDEVLVKE
jgi:hypothetical protein